MTNINLKNKNNSIVSDRFSWSEKTISEISKIVVAGATPSTKVDEYWDGSIPWLSSGEVNKRTIYETDRFITQLGYDKCSTKLIPKHCVLMALAGQGKTRGMVAINEIELCTNQSIATIVPNREIINYKYLFYNLLYRYDEIRSMSTNSDGGRGGLNLKIINSITVKVPPIREQQKIAEILSIWDLAIEKQQQLIEKKKEFKKGLMQRLLSGEVRFKEFKDEWSRKTLDQWITPISREQNKPNQGYWRLGLRSHGKGTFHEFVEDPETVSMDKLYEVKTNDLIVNITFAWEHAIAVANSDDDGKLVSHRFPTYQFNENAYPMYFKYYVLQPLFKNMLVNISPGGAGRNRVMNKKDFLKLEALIPSYEEQEKIAKVLKAADKEIELLQKELEALKLQKKGLMQRLLTGEVRVEI